MRPQPILWFVPLLLLGGAAANPAQAAGPDPSLSDMSLEELMNEPVTSVVMKATPLSESAAAIAVISQDDKRRIIGSWLAATPGCA